MKKQFKYMSVAVLMAALSLTPAMAKGGGGKGAGKGGGKAHQHKAAKHYDKKPQVHGGKHDKAFKPHHKGAGNDLWQPELDFDRIRHLALQNQFGGQKPLPPGIRKNLMRGKPLPPGIAQTRMPDGYAAMLPMRDGYEWRAYGSDLVLVSQATNLIAQVLSGALR